MLADIACARHTECSVHRAVTDDSLTALSGLAQEDACCNPCPLTGMHAGQLAAPNCLQSSMLADQVHETQAAAYLSLHAARAD